MRAAGMWTMKLALQQYITIRLRRRNKANPPAASCPWLSLHCHAIQQYAISSSFLFNLSLCHYSNLSTTPSSSVFILSFLPSTPSYCGSLSVAPPSNRYSVTQQPFWKFNYNQDVCLGWSVRGGWRWGKDRGFSGVGGITGLSLSVWVERFSRGTLLQQKAIYTPVS